MTRMEAILEVLRDGKAYRIGELAVESRDLTTEDTPSSTTSPFADAFQVLRNKGLIIKDKTGNYWMGTNTF